jgi:hypothetical protein
MSLKDIELLAHYSNLSTPLVNIVFLDRDTITPDLTPVRVIQPCQGQYNRGFTGTELTDERDEFTTFDLKEPPWRTGPSDS